MDLYRKMNNIQESLIAKIRCGNIEEANKLIQSSDSLKGLQPNCSTFVLHLAAAKGHIELVKMLLDRGADINAEDKYGKTLMCIPGLNPKTYIVPKSVTPLHLATSEGHIEMVKMLLDRGADIIAKKAQGWTSLHLAVSIRRIDILKLLLEKGGNTNMKSESGTTLLRLATHEGDIEIIKMLLDRGADINAKDAKGMSSLQVALRDNKIAIARLLLDNGANVNMKDKDDFTSLHWAAVCYSSDAIKIIEMILDAGVDIGATDTTDRTALKLAIEVENQEMITFLTQYIIKIKTAGFDVDKQNLDLIGGDSDFHSECKKEIETMKSEKVGSSSISFYRILMKSTRELAAWIKNIEVLELEDYKTKFPIYASMINKQYVKAKRRAGLLEPLYEIVTSSTNDYSKYLVNIYDDTDSSQL